MIDEAVGENSCKNLAGRLKQAIFGAPFLALSSYHGGEQGDHEKGCSVAQGAAEPAWNDPRP